MNCLCFLAECQATMQTTMLASIIYIDIFILLVYQQRAGVRRVTRVINNTQVIWNVETSTSRRFLLSAINF